MNSTVWHVPVKTSKLCCFCRPAVACSVSGVGEMIVRANLAKACFNQMLDPEQSVDEACGKVIRKTCEQARCAFQRS